MNHWSQKLGLYIKLSGKVDLWGVFFDDFKPRSREMPNQGQLVLIMTLIRQIHKSRTASRRNLVYTSNYRERSTYGGIYLIILHLGHRKCLNQGQLVLIRALIRQHSEIVNRWSQKLGLYIKLSGKVDLWGDFFDHFTPRSSKEP